MFGGPRPAPEVDYFSRAHPGYFWRAPKHYTVLRTCALNRVDPYTYLKDVLDKLAAGWPQQRIAELLPDAWAASRATAQSQAQAAHPTG